MLRALLKKLGMDCRKRPRKRRINLETDYEYLKKNLLPDPDMGAACISSNDEDLAILSKGTSVFLWESPLARSVPELEEMARQAAVEMTPSPGRIVRSAVLSVFLDMESKMDTIEQITGQLEQIYSEETNIIVSVSACHEQEGVRFALATSEESPQAIQSVPFAERDGHK